MTYIELRNVKKSFDKLEVLHGINLDIEKGQLVTLLGSSGCGKSTLLRCISGLETVSDGTITLDDKNITHIPVQRRDMGMVFQQYSLFPNMTVRKNIGYGLRIKKMSKTSIDDKVEHILELFGLSERAEHYPHQLSGGQQQRVALARSIVCEPKVLLLDEPLSAIDAMLRRNLQVEIRKVQKKLDITAIFVTHDQNEAMIMSDVIHLMNEGEIIQSGSPTSIYMQPESVFAANFIGHYNVIEAASFRSVAKDIPDCTTVAIRPEIIEISLSCKSDPGSYNFKGLIAAHVMLGNIIRYRIACGEFSLDVDVLCESDMMFNNDDSVYLSIKEDNIIPLG